MTENTKENINKTVYERLQISRVQLQDLKLPKTGKNQGFNYYELSDFLPAVNALCAKNGLFTRFNIITDRRIEKAVLTVYDSLDPQNKIDFVSPTAEVQLPKGQLIQNTGAKITYMRRYMLMTAFEIVESDIVDKINQDIMDELPQSELEKINSAKDFKELAAICKELKKDYKLSSIMEAYNSKKVQLEQQEPIAKVINKAK